MHEHTKIKNLEWQIARRMKRRTRVKPERNSDDDIETWLVQLNACQEMERHTDQDNPFEPVGLSVCHHIVDCVD